MPYLETQRGKEMYINVCNEREQTNTKVEFAGKTARDLLNQLKLNPEAFIIVRNSEVITEDELLQESDLIELLSVISGG